MFNFLGVFRCQIQTQKESSGRPLIFKRSKLKIRGSPLLCANVWHPETLRPVRPRLQDPGKDLNIGVEVQAFNPSL